MVDAGGFTAGLSVEGCGLAPRVFYRVDDQGVPFTLWQDA
jgi:hypothetical protein